ncbi:MAG: type I-MYXAN CRISPR-associated protein Cmx8 [Bryobacteraceae bacterium]
MGKPVEVIYDPFTLPTAQHRAGLAGLLIHRDTMERRGMEPLIEATEDEEGRWRVLLTEENLEAAFNDLYDAAFEEREQRQKRKKGKGPGAQVLPPKREVKRVSERTKKPETWYVYDQVIPKGAALVALGMTEPWLKLWREAMWSAIRGIPKTRVPFEQRAQGASSGEAEGIWSKIGQSKHSKKKAAVEDLSGSLLLGAQAANADGVPFRDLVSQSILLHFWPIVMGCFVPVEVDRDGKEQHTGHVLAIPDVADVTGFREDYGHFVATLSSELSGFRPRASVITIPEEAGIAYGAHLSAIAKGRAATSELRYTTASFEVFHLHKGERSVSLLHSGRVRLSRWMLEEYDTLRESARDALYRRQRVVNLLRGRPWYTGFDQLFATTDSERFVGPEARSFPYDVRRMQRQMEDTE